MAHQRGTRMIITAAGEDAPPAAAPPAETPPAGSGDDAPPADQVSPAPGTDPPAAAVLPVSPHGRFHALIIVQGEMTNDGRIFAGLAPRETPQWPLMAQDTTMPEHLESVLIGNFDRMALQGDEWHGWGSYLSDPDEQALNLINLVKSGELRGVSADVEPTEYEILWPVPEPGKDVTYDEATGMPEFPEPEITTIDGEDYEVMPLGGDPVLSVSEGFIMGATVLTFPAFARAFIEDDSGDVALAASGAQLMRTAGCTGVMLSVDDGPLTAAATATLPGREDAPSRFSFPDIPPAEWFDVPETPGPMPLTILDSGQVFGHLAIWGECHIGFGGECVEPPPSRSNYARFHVGEIPVAPDGRVASGRLTFATGHADQRLHAGPALAHYDNTGTVAADIVAVDGEYGIWVCGAARSSLTAAQVREVMASPPSGDWRRFGRDLELVGALCVNVPGFNTPRATLSASGAPSIEVPAAVRVRREDGQIASLIVSHPAPALTASAGAVHGLPDNIARQMMTRIAASVGRTTAARRAEIRARVHGGN